MSIPYPVQRERNVRVDAKHLPERVLVVAGLHVPVQHVLQHVQEGGVKLLHLDFALGLQSQGRRRAVGARALVGLLLRRDDLRPLVDRP